MAHGDEEALPDGSADEPAEQGRAVGDSRRCEDRANGRAPRGHGRVAVAFAGLGVGVAAAGLFLLPRLRTEVPVAPSEPSLGIVVPAKPIPGRTCPSRHHSREAL
jgi:hypothetical protein